MNYLPFAGSWFYGALSAAEMAAYYSSYGLLSSAPSLILAIGGSMFMSPHTNMQM